MLQTRHLIGATAPWLLPWPWAACASNPTNAQIGTGVGAAAGGLVGNGFGGTLGTVGGAAAGALIGHESGEDKDQRRAAPIKAELQAKELLALIPKALAAPIQ